MSQQRHLITVVRHGATEWSKTGQHTGRSNIPLTPDGEEDAKKLGVWLDGREFDNVYTSPLKRAQDTCNLAGWGDRAIVHDDLMEWDYGEFEGRTNAEVVAERPNWQIWTHGSHEGETVYQMETRIRRVTQWLLDHEGTTLLFAHGHFLRALAASWMELPVTEGRRVLLDTGAVGELGWYHGRRALARWNFTPEM